MGSHTSTVSRKNVTAITFVQSHERIEFRLVFRAPYRKFKMLAIPIVLAHEKLYEHGFTKKYDVDKLCAMSCEKLSFDRFFVHRLRNLKYWPFPTY
ncbi:hypothetical protein BHE74_00045636 [Ensete ventricosum]|nr:hypothetical protein BHE74_00045636 [Ensete ventricosum]